MRFADSETPPSLLLTLFANPIPCPFSADPWCDRRSLWWGANFVRRREITLLFSRRKWGLRTLGSNRTGRGSETATGRTGRDRAAYTSHLAGRRSKSDWLPWRPRLPAALCVVRAATWVVRPARSTSFARSSICCAAN
jgi:hypothetical protein